jgi:DNA-binding response OmpR family regulator
MATLVVVDDETLITEFLTFLFQNEGFIVHVASNGREGLETIARTRPDLVVTDLMMPVMSGVELAGKLREADELRDIPVILCSAVPDAVAERDQRLFSGFVQKPFAPATLVGLVREQLRARDARHAPDDIHRS